MDRVKVNRHRPKPRGRSFVTTPYDVFYAHLDGTRKTEPDPLSKEWIADLTLRLTREDSVLLLTDDGALQIWHVQSGELARVI